MSGFKINRRENPWYSIIQYGLEFIGRYYSSYRGFVINNEDPLGMGRLQLLIPIIDDTQPSETWAFPKNIWGGNNYGSQLLPQKGDMVWVEFEHGDTNYPIWCHAGYAEEEKPKEFETPYHYGFKTPSGSIILINDNKEKEEILVKLNTGTDWYKINKDVFELESKIIKLGKKGEEAAVMGDTLKSKLEAIMDRLDQLQELIINHNHSSNSGATSKPLNFTELEEVKSGLSTIKGELPDILSEKVKIDKTWPD